eukprot:COSAG02_NODE_2154_length_9654_cov_5.613919_2_plen_147_part_00
MWRRYAAMCLQCTLLSPLIEVGKAGGRAGAAAGAAASQQHAFAFMAQLDYQLGRLDFDMSTQVRQGAGDAEALVCVEHVLLGLPVLPCVWKGALQVHAAHRVPLASRRQQYSAMGGIVDLQATIYLKDTLVRRRHSFVPAASRAAA